MIAFTYLAALLVTIGCMALLDHRFRLFFWRDARRATIVMIVGVACFSVWDGFGIGLGIFHRGGAAWMTGIELAPEFPLEEVFFLAMLCYVTMNAYGWFTRDRTRARAVTFGRDSTPDRNSLGHHDSPGHPGPLGADSAGRTSPGGPSAGRGGSTNGGRA